MLTLLISVDIVKIYHVKMMLTAMLTRIFNVIIINLNAKVEA